MKNASSKLLTDGLIIGFISLFGYLFAFAFEVGYLSYYDIPLPFILAFVDLKLTNIFIAIGGSIAVFLSVLLSIEVISSSTLFNKAMKLHERMIIPIGLIIWLGVYIVIFGTNWNEYRHILLVTIIVLSYYFLYPLFSFKHIKSYKGKIKTHLSKQIFPGSTSLFDVLIRSSLFPLMLASLLLGAIVLPLVIDISHKEAMMQRVYPLIVYKHSKLAIIRIYDNKLLTMPVAHHKNGILFREMAIIDLDDVSKENVRIQFEEIGPITKIETKIPTTKPTLTPTPTVKITVVPTKTPILSQPNM